MASDRSQSSDRLDDVESIDPAGTTPPDATFGLRTFLTGSLALDVVVPIVAYQGLIHVVGMARVPALVLSGAFPAANVVRRYVQHRRVDPIGVIVLVSILVGAVLSLVSGSEKLTLLRESFLTAAFGLAFLVSLVFGRPIMFLLVRQFVAREDEQQLSEWDGLWEDVPPFRRVMRQMTAVWGIALLSEFALKVVMIETLSSDLVQAISGPLILVLTAVLIVATIRWGRRVRERGAEPPQTDRPSLRANRRAMSREGRLRSSCARTARENVGLLDRFEADTEIEMSRCWVVRFKADLDALGAGVSKPVDAGGEDVAGKSSPLMFVFGPHGFDETGGGLRIEPEQPVRGDAVATIIYDQVEVRAVARRLTQARLDVGGVPFGVDHVMWAQHRVEASGQPIVLVQCADLRPSVCGQPRLHHPGFLDCEAMADQHVTLNVIGAVDLDVDGFEAGLTSVSKAALHDLRNPIGSCVGHDDRVESYPVAPVGDDRCRFGATEVIEPEELTEMVGRARNAPP